jgi:sulfate adenylyltransferase
MVFCGTPIGSRVPTAPRHALFIKIHNRRVVVGVTVNHSFEPREGFTVFFTGLSGAGKSTLANLLTERLIAHGRTDITLLDGDAVRHHLSSELGFSKEHRRLHVLRVGFVAQAVTRSGGIAVCALIAPYDDVRQEVRAMVAEVGRFVLVHVATALEVCEQRDPKGLYARARAGAITHFTGVSDPYEIPPDAEIAIDTASARPDEAVATILNWLVRERLLRPNARTLSTLAFGA